MLNFRKSIAAAIVLCLVGLSTAWAFDVHALDVSHPEQLIDVSDPAPIPDQHSHSGDHSCHGGAHLVGIDRALPLTLPVTQAAPQSMPFGSLFVSHTNSPPLRPPQS
jgi:hypothetical protein